MDETPQFGDHDVDALPRFVEHSRRRGQRVGHIARCAREPELDRIKALDGAVVQVVAEIRPLPLRNRESIACLRDFRGESLLTHAGAQRHPDERRREQGEAGAASAKEPGPPSDGLGIE